METTNYTLAINLEFQLESNDPINIANALLELKAMLGDSNKWTIDSVTAFKN